ncbi:MAG: isochorismatase family protein [Elusimicrobia bacterium]|nr:isochorismatase family protein [Elusimicrobiota bacterium]
MKVLETRSVGPLGQLYLARLSGEKQRLIEFVDTVEPGVPKAQKWVLMLSTQVGCVIGCRMCDGGAMGWRGNLTAGEIVAQVRRVVKDNPGLDARRHPKFKIHFARLGEPTLNPATPEALELLAAEWGGPGLTASISTVAPDAPAAAQRLEEMLEVKDRLYRDGRFQLQFSAHSTDESVRRRVMRARPWSLERVADFGRRWVRPGDRKVTLNFALAPDQPLDPEAVARTFDAERFLVKITPVNPTRASEASGSSRLWNEPPPDVAAAAAGLRARGFTVILSPSTPEEVAAETSCGQLWSSALRDEARAGLRADRLESGCYVVPGTMPEKARSWMSDLSRFEARGEPLRPGKAGLLVVDLIDFFVDRNSSAYLPQSRAAVLGAVRLLEAFRAAGRPVFFARHAHRDPERDGGLMTGWWAKVCREGRPESRVTAALAPRPGETVLRKTRYSAFSNPRLAPALRAAGVSDLVVCGLATNLCVESTVRAAFDLGLSTFVPADATVAHDEELHLGALRSLAQGFSRVMLVDDVAAALASPKN